MGYTLPFREEQRSTACRAAIMLRFLVPALVTAVCLALLPAHTTLAQETPLPTAGPLPVQAGQVLSPNSVHIESIRSMGGSASAYAAEGDFLFVGQGTGIAVIDASNPNNPVETARFGPLDGVVRHITVQDHILFAALGEAGLAILDATTPTAMKTLARYPAANAAYVAVEGQRAYVADSWRGLLLLDVRQPAAPALLGTLDVTEWITAVSIADQRAYISLGFEGLLVASVADPASPRKIAQHGDLMTWHKLEFAGNLAFVIGRDGKAYAYDFSNPAGPKRVAALTYSGGMDIRGRYAYVAGWGGVSVWDVSQPEVPVLLSQREDVSQMGWGEAIAGPEALYVATEDGYITVFDLAQPSILMQTGSLSLSESSASVLGLEDSRLVVATGPGLTSYNLAEAENAAPAAPYSLSGQAIALAMCGQRVFVAVDGGQRGLEIVQIEAANELKRFGFLPTDAAIHELYCSDAYVYARQSDRLLVIDASSPAKPRQVGSYAVASGVKAMALDPPRAYVADGSDTLHIVDISRPTDPRRLGTYVDPNAFFSIGKLAAGSGFVYLGRQDQVDVVDTSDAAQPRALGSLFLGPSSISALLHQDSHLLVYYDDTYYGIAALHFVNVTDPAHPVETAVFEPAFSGPDIVASAGVVAFADEDNGVAAYWWSPAVTATFVANVVVEFSPTADVTYRLDAARLQPAGTVNLEHFRPFVAQPAQTALDEAVAPFTLRATDAASGKTLAPSAPLQITVRLSAEQLEGIDPQSVALYTWNGAAWVQLPSSRFDATSGELTASVSQLAPWSVRARPRIPATAVYMPFLARPGADVALSGFEVTQSTQSLSNSVPLVAGKAALARIYATTNGAEPARDVYLSLTATRDGVVLPASPIQRGPWAVFPTWDRGEYGTSFNVPLPLDWTHGNVTLTADLRHGDGAKDGDPSNNRRAFSVKFVDVPSLDLMIVPMNYIHTPSGEVYPPPTQEQITDWIARIYPIPGIRVSFHAPVTFRGDLTTDADFSRVTRLMLDIRRSENAPAGRAYYGLLPGGASYMWGGKGFIGLRASAGINGGVTAGHELGHNFGRLHAPCGNPGGPDPNYPYPEASIGEYGFDFGSYTIWTPTEGKDFMSYCYPRWTSDYTYLGLLADQLKHGSVAAQATEAADSPVLWVRAVLHDDGSAEFLPIYGLTGSPDARPEAATCHVLLWSDAGQALADHPIQIHEAADGEPLRYASAMLPLPSEPVRAATLSCDGRERARAAILEAVTAASTPQVRQEDSGLNLEWEATGPALVQYRRESDTGWSTLSVDQTDGVLTLDPAALPGGALQFRVVRAGNAAVAVESVAAAETVVLPDKPPRVWITGPAAVAPGASVVLFGHGFDTEDGVLDKLTWFVNGAPAGSGQQILLLAPVTGSLEVMVSAMDAAGQRTTAIHHMAVTAE